MRKFISSIPPASITDAIVAAFVAAITPSFTPYKINLEDNEKLGLRTFAEGREGYVRNVSRVANQFPEALGRSDVPTELSNIVDYYERLEAMRLAAIKAVEIIIETELGVAADGMTLADRYVQNLQISRGNDASLDAAITEIYEYNSRFANGKKPNQDNLPE